MAMNGDILGKAIADAIVDSEATAEGKQKCEEIWKKIAGEIVSHIQTYATVPAGISVSTTGTQSAQTGATTAPGSVQ